MESKYWEITPSAPPFDDDEYFPSAPPEEIRRFKKEFKLKRYFTDAVECICVHNMGVSQTIGAMTTIIVSDLLIEKITKQ